jgi:hypothetical protein
VKHKRFIPSQRIKGSGKEIFIINYEGSVIKLERTTNLYEPLIVRLNGELLETIPSKQNKEIEFSTADGKHKLQVWNERVLNSFIPKIFVKDGIAAVIDGVPVQNSLADPIARLRSGKALIWLLTLFFFVRAFVIPLTTFKDISGIQQLPIVYIFIIVFILLLSSALTFKLNPIRSTWIALIISFLELAWYIFSIIITVQIGLLTLLFLIFRLAIFSGLILTLRNLKHILSFGEERSHYVAESQPEQKIKKQFTFKLKYAVILIVSILIMGGLYLTLSEFIKISSEPSLKRDNSLEFRTDLKLPELIPYRKEGKWGFANSEGKIFIEPKYSRVQFFNLDKFFLEVEKDGLEGIIKATGEEIIPCIYKDIYELTEEPGSVKWELYQYLKSIKWENLPTNFKAFTDSLNNRSFMENTRLILAANDLESGKMEANEFRNLLLSEPYKHEFKVRNTEDEEFIVDANNNIVTKLENENLEKQKEQETYSSFEVNLEDRLKLVYEERKIYNILYPRGDTEKFYGIKDIDGKIILPLEYAAIKPAGGGTVYNVIEKTNYASYESKMGLINSYGEIVIPCKYDEIIYGYYGNFNDKYIVVQNDGLYGVIDFDNHIILDDIYERITVQLHGSDYYFAVKDRRKNKTGLIKAFDWLGYPEVVIPFEYDRLAVDKEGNNWIRFKKNNRYGAIDFNNNIVVPAKFIWGLRLSDGLAAAKFVEPDTITKAINSNKIDDVSQIAHLEEIHHGLNTGSRSFNLGGRIIYNPDYAYKYYTTFKISKCIIRYVRT